MSNINPIDIFPGINDVPVAPTAQQGSNGSYVIEKVNEVITEFNLLKSQTGGATPASIDNVEIYLDTVNGNDTNNGTTSATAFKTWNKAVEQLEGNYLGGNVYIYVSGTLQAPLNLNAFTGIWDLDESKKLNIEGINGVEWNITGDSSASNFNRNVFLSSNTLSLSIRNCKFTATQVLDFNNVNINFGSGCKFIGGGSGYQEVIFRDGSFTLDEGVAIGTEYDPCYVAVTGSKTVITLNTVTLGAMYENHGAFLIKDDATAYINGPVTSVNSVEIAFEKGAKGLLSLDIDPDGNLTLKADSLSSLKWRNDLTGPIKYSGLRYTSVANFPTLVNGQYLLWAWPRRCRLVGLKYRADSGSGTCQFACGYGATLGSENIDSAVSINNTINAFEVNSGFGLAKPPLGATQTYGLVAKITNASGLTNCWFQIEYIDY